jgi:hypothetical protein
MQRRDGTEGLHLGGADVAHRDRADLSGVVEFEYRFSGLLD